MARTITEIKEGIAADFMRNEAAASAYGFTPGDSFTERFSKVSVEGVLFYVAACAVWVLECLFDAHKADVDSRIDEILPHRPKWYRDKALRFMKGKVLLPDSDEYDTSAMSEEEMAAARVVKHAVAVESRETSVLTVKVAGESDGRRTPLDEGTARQLAAYFAEIKDAGVRIDVVNKEADPFSCEVDIYYDAMLAPETVKTDCEAAIKSYIENLPFNGEYTNMALVDALQGVEGVKVVEFVGASTTDGAAINARYIPDAGYFRVDTLTLNLKVYNNG